MDQAKVKSIEFAAHVHATEDLKKVRKAIENLIPKQLRYMIRYTTEVLEGHYGNPITRLQAILVDKAAEETVRYIASKLDEQDKLLLSVSFNTRYDEKEGKLYLRFSKQEAYLNRVRLMDGDDVIRVVISFRGAPDTDKARRLSAELGLLPS